MGQRPATPEIVCRTIAPSRFIFIVECTMPSESLTRISALHFRCWNFSLACPRSNDPSAARPPAPRLRRPVLRCFRRVPARLHPSSATPLERVPVGDSCTNPGRSDKLGCVGTVEVEHALETPSHWPPQEATLSSPAKGSFERDQASQMRSHRQRTFIYESSDSSGTKHSNDKNEFSPKPNRWKHYHTLDPPRPTPLTFNQI